MIHTSVSSLSPTFQWVLTAVAAPILTGVAASVVPGAIDPTVAAAVGTGVALHAQAQMQSPAMQAPAEAKPVS